MRIKILAGLVILFVLLITGCSNVQKTGDEYEAGIESWRSIPAGVYVPRYSYVEQSAE
jgi:PBP1b-binding outer membrane lipoprotein LpoB